MPTDSQLDLSGCCRHIVALVAARVATVGAVERVLVAPSQPTGPALKERKPMLPLGSYRGAQIARDCLLSGEEWNPQAGRPPPI